MTVNPCPTCGYQIDRVHNLTNIRAAAIATVASSHKLQDGRHAAPEGFVLVSENAIVNLNAALARTD